MPDNLIDAWLAIREFIRSPAALASLAAMFMSALKMGYTGGLLRKKKWLETLMVGFLSYFSIPVITYWGFDPEAGAFFGAMLGYLGIHTMEEKLDRLIDNFAGIASALRRK